jgi:hypothetical protein
MSKESKKGQLGDLIAEEISGASSADKPLDHGFDQLEPMFTNEDGEAINETRLIRQQEAAPGAPVVADKRMEPIPSGLRAWFELVGTAQTFSIKKSMSIIGRVREVADFVIADDELSRHHAALTYADGQFFIEDLDSTNGTFVKDARIKRVHLQHGDVVRLGRHKLKLFVEE